MKLGIFLAIILILKTINGYTLTAKHLQKSLTSTEEDAKTKSPEIAEKMTPLTDLTTHLEAEDEQRAEKFNFERAMKSNNEERGGQDIEANGGMLIIKAVNGEIPISTGRGKKGHREDIYESLEEYNSIYNKLAEYKNNIGKSIFGGLEEEDDSKTKAIIHQDDVADDKDRAPIDNTPEVERVNEDIGRKRKNEDISKSKRSVNSNSLLPTKSLPRPPDIPGRTRATTLDIEDTPDLLQSSMKGFIYKFSASEDDLIFGILIGCILVLIILTAIFNSTSSHTYFTQAHKSLYKIILLLILVIIFLHILDTFNNTKEWQAVSFGISLYLFVLILFTFLLSWMIGKTINHYHDMETNVNIDRKSRYMGNYYEYEKIERRSLEYLCRSRKDILEYVAIRLEFLTPAYIINTNEAYLRPDFPFSEYLGRAFGKTLQHLCEPTVLSYIFLILYLTLWRILLFINRSTHVYLMLLIPLIIFLILGITWCHLSDIYHQLVPYISEPDQLPGMAAAGNERIDPYDHLQNMPIPPYLDQNLNPQIGPIACSCCQRGPVRANRHQALMIGGRSGEYILRSILQSCYNTLLVWTVVFACDHADDALLIGKYLGPFFVLVVYGLIIYFMIIFFPSVIRKYTFSMNIQMKKDWNIINDVVNYKKSELALILLRVFRVLKLIRVEIMGEKQRKAGMRQAEPILLEMLRQLREEDEEEGEEEKPSLPVSQLDNFLLMCGGDPSKLGSYLLLKKSQSRGESISYDELVEALSMYMYEAKMGTLELVVDTFQLYHGENVIQISFTDFLKIFTEYESYFEPGDVDCMIKEFRLVNQGESVKLDTFALFIRDEVDHYPQ